MTRETAYQEILRRTGLEDKHVLCAYMYGSRVYGTARKNSDWDFIVVLANSIPVDKKHYYTEGQFSDNLININFYLMDTHRQRIRDCEPSAMECVFLPKDFILKSVPIPEVDDILEALPLKTVDTAKLRSSYSAKASNSWVKAKKKLTVEKDYNDLVGKKSLWHSLRLLDYGWQIAYWGHIFKWDSMNHLYDEILYCKDWTELFEKYKQMYNSMSTEFRKVAPKVQE